MSPDDGLDMESLRVLSAKETSKDVEIFTHEIERRDSDFQIMSAAIKYGADGALVGRMVRHLCSEPDTFARFVLQIID